MRSPSLTKLTIAAVVTLAALVSNSALAGAGILVTFDPDPVRAGDTVSVTVSGTWPECNNQEGAPSYILIVVPDGDDIEGGFPGGGTTGTITIPADLEPGTYDMEIQCSFSVGNSTYFPDLSIDILAALPTTLPPEPTTSASSSTTAAAVAAATSPRFTG